MAAPIEGKQIAEYAHDLQVSLSSFDVPHYDRLPFVGMAGILAMHIRGLGEIPHGTLRLAASHFFDIPPAALPEVLRILAEVEYVTINQTGSTINSIIPQVPHFSSVYEGLGDYIGTVALTEHERLSVSILDELSSKPDKRDALFGRLGAEKTAFDTCEQIVTAGGLVLPKRARGHDILVSPTYFADNLDGLADLAAAGNAGSIKKLLGLLKTAQGWPLSIILSSQEISGTKLTPGELQMLRMLVSDGILKPPSIERPTAATEHFVFTPKPGKARLDASKREIYERAMALVAAVRKGQLVPEAYRIHSPVTLLSALRDRGFVGANSDARVQYTNLVALRVGRLELTGSDRYKFVLLKTEENIEAINEAISLLKSGVSMDSATKKDARIALTQDEKYLQSTVSAARLKAKTPIALTPEGTAEIEQLLLRF